MSWVWDKVMYGRIVRYFKGQIVTFHTSLSPRTCSLDAMSKGSLEKNQRPLFCVNCVLFVSRLFTE